MADAKLRWGAAWLVLVAGCSRCNDERCDGNDCVTNLDESSSSSAAGDDDDDDGASAPTSDDDDGNATTDAASTTGPDDRCHGTDECPQQFCVAPYADNVRGAFACVSECVAPMDESVWCYDDAACCDAAASCTIRGYCEVMDATSDGSSSGVGSSDEGSSSDAGTDTSSSSTG
ncbi:MAG TPA: hypothetical protein VFG69_21710 [Nannocystaceae bacterium]|nr:hypothetical protein [Nannocystaceae bacterium]